MDTEKFVDSMRTENPKDFESTNGSVSYYCLSKD